jgi:hypothetical protein
VATAAGKSGDGGRKRQRKRKQDDVVMAGPIPLLRNTHHQRNIGEPFEEVTAIPPMDVDGLSRIADHPVQVCLTQLMFFLILTFLSRRNALVAFGASSVASHATGRNPARSARPVSRARTGASMSGPSRSAWSSRTPWARVSARFPIIVRLI